MTPLVITEAAIDSRQVIPGGMFVAIPGENVDGHDFVTQAFHRGAVLALIEHEIAEPFDLIDLRKGLLPNQLPRLAPLQGTYPPVCVLVENTVSALQQI